MENRIKEQQLGLFADRTSTRTLRGNQLRLWFSSIAYLILHDLRRLALCGTALGRAQVSTIRSRLLKIGAVVKVSVRRVYVVVLTEPPKSSSTPVELASAPPLVSAGLRSTEPPLT